MKCLKPMKTYDGRRIQQRQACLRSTKVNAALWRCPGEQERSVHSQPFWNIEGSGRIRCQSESQSLVVFLLHSFIFSHFLSGLAFDARFHFLYLRPFIYSTNIYWDPSAYVASCVGLEIKPCTRQMHIEPPASSNHDLLFFFIDFLNLFLERGREGESKGEKHPCERETSISCLLYTPRPGTKLAIQPCALTGNWTCNLLLCRTMPSQLSHTSQGS